MTREEIVNRNIVRNVRDDLAEISCDIKEGNFSRSIIIFENEIDSFVSRLTKVIDSWRSE